MFILRRGPPGQELPYTLRFGYFSVTLHWATSYTATPIQQNTSTSELDILYPPSISTRITTGITIAAKEIWNITLLRYLDPTKTKFASILGS